MDPLLGLHHVTAVTGDAPANLAFYRDTLGLRLVKKTVNQDDTSAYHLFYADDQGSPGTEVTFFDWPRAGTNVPGSGTVSEVALRVAGGRSALERCQTLLRSPGGMENGRASEVSFTFTDPEGQRLRLVSYDEGTVPTPAGLPLGFLGLDGVTLAAHRPDVTARVLVDVLGLTPTGEDERGRCFQVGPDRQDDARRGGQTVRLASPPPSAPGQVGIGGVHHVAFRVRDAEVQRAWRERIVDAGLPVSEVIDRFYFQALYFREPGGVLCEISTDGPGFAADEDPAHLGESLSLPPFLEGRRAAIEARLQPLPA